jgi:GTP:adenosylcobinamide-phosphate guanylyltransferase
MPKKYTAIVLAGDRGQDDPLLVYEGVSTKALIRVAGQTIVKSILGELRTCAVIDRIIVVGQDQLKEHLADDITFVRQADGPSQSVINALELLEDKSQPIFLTTVDHRLLRAADVKRFVNSTETASADLSLAAVRTDDVIQKYPTNKRTRLVFKDGAFSACNMFMARPDRAVSLLSFWTDVEQHRKSPLKIARRIGLMTALSIYLKRLNFDQVLRHIGCKFGLSIVPIYMHRVELAIDIDKIEDLTLVRQIVDQENKQKEEVA